MDKLTITAYSAQAQERCAWYRQLTPGHLHQVGLGFFHPGAPTADIGCGSGRDSHWLRGQGFPTVGYDATPAMLEQARLAYPDCDFQESVLPELSEIPDEAFANVLCNATLMHVSSPDLITAVLNLARILKPDGRLLLSYRSSQTGEERAADGRLFTAIPSGKLTLLLEAAGLQVVLSQELADAQRSGVTWYTLLAQKNPLLLARGLERIQAVLVQDRKVATYKLALIRALCVVSRTQSHLVQWGQGLVYVPLWSLAVQWLTFYWPLVTAPEFIIQMAGEKPDATNQLAFRSVLMQFAQEFGRAGLYDLLKQLDENPLRFKQVLGKISTTIKNGPVTYSGTTGPRVFDYAPKAISQVLGVVGSQGWVVVPEAIWLDICRFDGWIEDSVVLRWAQLTARMNPLDPVGIGKYLPLLLATPGAERDTREMRTLFQGRKLECVWSGQTLGNKFHIDHVIPYAVWGNNDLWNLLPCNAQVNNNKRDHLPTQALLMRRKDCIIAYWQEYQNYTPQRFAIQLDRALGCQPGSPGWERIALAGLQENIERLATSRGLERWEV